MGFFRPARVWSPALFVFSSAYAVGCGDVPSRRSDSDAGGREETGESGGASSTGGMTGTGATVGIGGSVASGGRGVAGGSGGILGTGGSGGILATGGAGGSGHEDAGAGGISSHLDAGTGGGLVGDAGPFGTIREIASPPSYRGSVNNSAECTREYVTRGFEPSDATDGPHPLFLYFTGTNFGLDEAAFREQALPAVNAVTRAMARRGFLALHVEYDNTPLAWASDHSGLLGCLYGSSNPNNVLAVACALPQVDCDLGIGVWGHSLGGVAAHFAADFDSRVRAVWLTGYGNAPDVAIADDRVRVVNGENDFANGQVATLNPIAGFTVAECPDDGRSECLRPDGSGWIIVRRADCQANTADHCWFDKVDCLQSAPSLEPNWVDPDSTKPFALESNADWVAATAVRR